MSSRYVALGSLLFAAMLISTASAREPQRKIDLDSLMVEARAAIGAGQYETAVRQLNQVLAWQSKRADARFQLAVAYRELGRLHSARRHFRLALSSDAANGKWVARCRCEIARTWEMAGEFREALAEYRLALEADPGSGEAEAGQTRAVAAKDN